MANLRVFTRSWLVFIAGLVCIQIVIAWYKKMLDKLDKSPETRAAEDWAGAAESAATYREDQRTDLNEFAKANRDLLKRFSRPSDQNYRAWLKQDHEKSLKDSELVLKKLKNSRP